MTRKNEEPQNGLKKLTSNAERKAEEPIKKENKSDIIWNEIKDLPISMFALPNQKVSDHVRNYPIPGDKVYLKPTSNAVIASLETSIAEGVATNKCKEYDLQLSENGFIIVQSSKVDLPDEILAMLEAQK